MAEKMAMTKRKKTVVCAELPGRYGRMSAKQLDQEVAKFDREFVIDESRPLTRRQREQERRARRKPGRPVVGKGAQRVLVTIERGLLRRSDAYAKQHGLTRAKLVARGLETVLRDAG